MQEPHFQNPSVAGHGLSYWLWYHSILVGKRECISSEHFSEGFLSRTWAVYLVVLVQLMLIWWKLYTRLSVCKLASTAEDWHQLYMYKRGNQLGWWICHQQVRTCLCISFEPLCCKHHESSKPAKAASTGFVFVRLGYEGWNPSTCYLPCNSRTRYTHWCHNMWLCSTGKGLQHII